MVGPLVNMFFVQICHVWFFNMFYCFLLCSLQLKCASRRSLSEIGRPRSPGHELPGPDVCRSRQRFAFLAKKLTVHLSTFPLPNVFGKTTRCFNIFGEKKSCCFFKKNTRYIWKQHFLGKKIRWKKCFRSLHGLLVVPTCVPDLGPLRHLPEWASPHKYSPGRNSLVFIELSSLL